MSSPSSSVIIPLALFVTALAVSGCDSERDAVREIQAQQQSRLQSETVQDHLGDAFLLLDRWVELNPAQAERQLVYHLNRWQIERPTDDPPPTPELVRTLREVLPQEEAIERVDGDRFVRSDISHLRDSYVFQKIVQWVDQEGIEDPVLADWFEQVESDLGEDVAQQLRTASRLFDWTVRNVAFEPMQLMDQAPPAPPMSSGIVFRGPGYRQSDYQTVWRGTGDSLQRAGVFTQLCRQASIPAFVLGLVSNKTGDITPWCVGVLIGEDIYLFEPQLGIHVPGPDQVGIATLAQARRDASVLRRLNVPGFFDYPVSKSDVQQCVALLNLLPEALSARMKHLESALTGDRRMIVYVDADQLAEEIDAVRGISGVRLWSQPILSEAYARDLAKASERDPMLQFWNLSRWAFLESSIEGSRGFALGRWLHLLGKFDKEEEDDSPGARQLYLAQRAPEFEIEDLDTKVDLQIAYGVRRDLGISQEQYQQQIQMVQQQIRLGKRTATYWISLVQYDSARFDNARDWLKKRVLDEDQLAARWVPSARYNLGRAFEQLGEYEQAIELYKTDGAPNEHGNRIRARLIGKLQEEPAQPETGQSQPE